MKTFSTLARVSAVSILVLVFIGGLVRATGSGLGCLDDWPLCQGGWFAPLEYKAIIEWSHRVWAAWVGVAVTATAVAGIRAKAPAFRRWLSVALVVVVGIQGLFGRWVVHRDLHSGIVTLHFLTGMLIVVMVTILAVVVDRDRRPSEPGVSRFASSGVVLIAVLMLFGSLVRQYGAGLAFTTWPHMDLIPSGTDEVLMWIHRVFAVLVGGHIFMVFRAARRVGGDVGRWGNWLAAGFAAQIIIGGLNVLSSLAAWAVLGHVAVGGATLAAATAVAAAAATSRKRVESAAVPVA